MKSIKQLLSVITLTAATLVVSNAGAQSVPAGYTLRAVKVMGGTSWPTTCRLAKPRLIGLYSSHTSGGCGILCAPDFIYQAQAGTTPTISCATNVNDGPWVK